MKKLIGLLVFLFISLNISMNIFAQSAAEKIRVGVLNGPSSIPAAWLMENYKSAEFTKHADPQALLPKLIKEEVDVGFFPLNVAAKVFNSTNGAVICAAVTGNGNLSVISTVDVKRFTDLKNKTIYVAGQGATPEYITRYLLEQNELKIGKDVILDYSIPTAQIAANLISGKIKYAVVPEPFSTIAEEKSEKVKRVLNLQNEYMAFNETLDNFPLTVLVVRKAYAEKHADELNNFLINYKKAFEWTIKNPKSAGNLVEKNDLGLASGIVTKSIPKANYVYIPAKEAKNKIEALLNIYLTYSPEAIGGKLPSNDFYYDQENP